MSNLAELNGIGMTSRRTRMRLVQRLRDQGVEEERVLAVIAELPRHIFIDEALAHRAYEDTALPIGHQQTISQPYIVARMTELLMESEPRRVLELGTGSGYQAAVLSRLVNEVYSVERILPLQQRAAERFAQLQLRNVALRHVDGNQGWPEAAPFDAMIFTAAAKSVPVELLRQLKEGGRLIMPLGDHHQYLTEIIKRGNQYEANRLERVTFVPVLSGVIH